MRPLTSRCRLQFGGLFVQAPQLPPGWRWANVIDPVTYTLEALTTPQFYTPGCPPPAGTTDPNCPTIIPYPGAQPQDLYTYFSSSFGLYYQNRWKVSFLYFCEVEGA
jgi:hypothetical protein